MKGLQAWISLLLPWRASSWTRYSPVDTMKPKLQSSRDDRNELLSHDRRNHRKRKKNKYEKFSKVEHQDKDPWEALIAESELKNRMLVEEQEYNARRFKPVDKDDFDPPSIMIFPDTKEIDPYDPTTFGYVPIATVRGAHGVYGWIKIQSTTDFPKERLCTPGVRHMKYPNKRAPRQVLLLEGKPCYGGDYLVRLEGINTREAAQQLRGSILYSREEDKLQSDQEEFVVDDLVGLDVFLNHNTDGEKQFVGKVAGIVFAEDISDVPGMGHDMLEITLPRGPHGMPSLRDELVLVPFVPQLVPEVDVPGGSIVIDPPDGLLDLTFVREEKVRIKAFLPPAKTS